jgi:hypothetical protein
MTFLGLAGYEIFFIIVILALMLFFWFLFLKFKNAMALRKLYRNIPDHEGLAIPEGYKPEDLNKDLKGGENGERKNKIKNRSRRRDGSGDGERGGGEEATGGGSGKTDSESSKYRSSTSELSDRDKINKRESHDRRPDSEQDWPSFN